MLRLVVRVRRQLLWAQSRTRTGRRSLFLAGYIVGGSLLLLLSLGASASATLSMQPGHGEDSARWIFTAIWINGSGVSLLLGRGARSAALDAVLRRYPMTRLGRLCVRHVSGFLDPVWLLLSAVALGLSAGSAVAAPGSILLSLPVVIIFVAICYLSSLVLISVVDVILSRQAGGTIIGAAVLVLFSAAGLVAASTIDPANASWWHEADLVLRFLPPGAAASIVAGAQLPSGLLDVLTLFLWCGLLTAALVLAERYVLSGETVTSISDSFGALCDGIAGLFGNSLSPLIGKSLRYHMRCDRVRFSLAATVPLTLLLPHFMGRGNNPYRTFLETMALMFLAATLATASVTLNQFGYDGNGVRRYWILPVPAVSVVRAAGIASMLMGGTVVLVAIAGLPFLAGFPLDARVVAILAASACSGLFLFNAIGLWTSVLSPRRSDFRGVMGNELSFSATLVIGLGIAFALAAAFVVEDRIPAPQLLNSWLGFTLLAPACATLCLISHRAISTIVTARRELISRAVSGPEHP